LDPTDPKEPAICGEVPGYSQLAQLLRDQIHRGKYHPGERLPPLRELGEKHGVSRSTVHAAVKQLAADGLLETLHGKGRTRAMMQERFDEVFA